MLGPTPLYQDAKPSSRAILYRPWMELRYWYRSELISAAHNHRCRKMVTTEKMYWVRGKQEKRIVEEHSLSMGFALSPCIRTMTVYGSVYRLGMRKLWKAY